MSFFARLLRYDMYPKIACFHLFVCFFFVRSFLSLYKFWLLPFSAPSFAFVFRVYRIHVEHVCACFVQCWTCDFSLFTQHRTHIQWPHTWNSRFICVQHNAMIAKQCENEIKAKNTHTRNNQFVLPRKNEPHKPTACICNISNSIVFAWKIQLNIFEMVVVFFSFVLLAKANF